MSHEKSSVLSTELSGSKDASNSAIWKITKGFDVNLLKMIIAGCIAGLLGAWLLILSGCAKDQNALDYRNKQFADQLALLQKANGSYTGPVIARKAGAAPAGSTVGGMRITLQAQSQVTTTTDGTPNQKTPTLTAAIEFQGNTKINLSAQTTAYDPDTGIFETDIKVSTASGTSSSGSSSGTSDATSQVITIAGILGSGEFRGSITVVGYEDYGADLDLKKTGPSLDQIAKTAHPVDPLQGLRKGFAGTTVFKGGTSKPVQLILQNPSSTDPLSFLDLFSPVKPVTMTFSYGSDSQLVMNDSVWQQDDQKITGQEMLVESGDGVSQSSGSSGSNSAASSSASSGSSSSTTPAPGGQLLQLSVVCNGDNSTGGFVCSTTQQSDSTVVAVTTVAPVHGDPTPAPDDSSSRDAVTAKYAGTGNFQGTVLKAGASVIYAARTRIVEIFDLLAPPLERSIAFTFYFENPYGLTTVSFPSVKWDIVNGTIDGTQTVILNGNSSVQYISCTHFEIGAPKYDFTCRYSTTFVVSDTLLHFVSGSTPVKSSPVPPQPSPTKKPKK